MLGVALRSFLADQIRAEAAPVGALVTIDDGERIRVDGRLWDPGEGQSVFDQLVYVLMHASLEADTGRLHLHAGLVEHAGRGLLVGGLAGSGKSTMIRCINRLEEHQAGDIVVDGVIRVRPGNPVRPVPYKPPDTAAPPPTDGKK